MPRLSTTGALGGAGTGALYGAKFGGPIGAGIGGLLGGIGGLFGGGRRRPKRVSTFDPKQREVYNQYIQALQGRGGPLADVFGQTDPAQLRGLFDQNFAQPAYQNFQENIVPGITGQFRGQNLQNSSYLGGALGKAGTDVQRDLDAKLAEILFAAQQGDIARRQQGAEHILGLNTFDYRRPSPSRVDSLLDSLGGGAAAILKDLNFGRGSRSSATNPLSGASSSFVGAPAIRTPITPGLGFGFRPGAIGG